MNANEQQKRLDREHKQFVANRRGKGKARVRVTREPVHNTPDGKRVSGFAIVIRPLTFNRDRLRAFKQWCKMQGIALASVASNTRQGEGFPEQTVDIAYLAFCPDSDSINALKEHNYVGKGRWQYATNVSVGSQAKLAAMPKETVKESELCPFADDNKPLILQVQAEKK